MAKNRREFIKAGLLGGAVAASSLPAAAGISVQGENSEPRNRVSKPLNILILGGTGFIGPHMVREFLRRRHNVTLFNRGRTNSSLFPDLETIKGDRAGDLEGLAGREWDAAVDNSGYMPQYVGHSAATLSPNIGHYLFVSSISAYAVYAQPNDEDSALASMDDADAQEFSWDFYGALKARCERAAAAEMGDDRLTVIRPTYVCGPGDHTDRFTYWPVRTRKGEAMLWAGTPASEIQIIDVRDLANFVVDNIENKTTGTYNMVTPVGSYTMGNLLEDSQAVLGASVDPVWVSDEFVADQGAETAGALPIWHPASGEYAHVSSVSGERARAAGLRNRPVRETIRDLMTWWDTLPAERIANAGFGMTLEREAELIAAWEARS